MSIGSPAMGFEEVAGFGQESTYGSAASIRTPGWVKPLSFTLKNTDPPMMLGGPSGGSVPFVYSASLPRHFRGVQRVAGNITVECDYEMLGVFLSGAIGIGTVGANLDIDGGASAGTYLHTFNMLGNSTTANTTASMTIARLNGMEDLQFLGCMIDTLEISANADSIVTISMDIIGQSGGNAEVADTDAEGYSAAPFIEFHDSCINYNATTSTAYTAAAIGATPLSGGAAPLTWSVRVENNLRAVASSCLSGRTIREPIYQGYRKASFTFSRDYWNDTFFNHQFPATEPAAYAAYEIRCTSDEAAGADFYAASFYMPAGIVVGDPNEYGGGADIESETITVEAAAPSAAAVPFTARLANTESVAFA
jgi:hypothetical protein